MRGQPLVTGAPSCQRRRAFAAVTESRRLAAKARRRRANAPPAPRTPSPASPKARRVPAGGVAAIAAPLPQAWRRRRRQLRGARCRRLSRRGRGVGARRCACCSRRTATPPPPPPPRTPPAALGTCPQTHERRRRQIEDGGRGPIQHHVRPDVLLRYRAPQFVRYYPTADGRPSPESQRPD
jgi:hypothetical protein